MSATNRFGSFRESKSMKRPAGKNPHNIQIGDIVTIANGGRYPWYKDMAVHLNVIDNWSPDTSPNYDSQFIVVAMDDHLDHDNKIVVAVKDLNYTGDDGIDTHLFTMNYLDLVKRKDVLDEGLFEL